MLSRRRDDRGAVAIISSLVSLVLLVIAAFVVDIGGTWARRGELQKQADEAALYAARWLPARTADEQREVAKQVAFYFCDNPVMGQDELTTFPTCATPDDPAVATWTDQLIAEGRISFPSPTQVKVTTPPAQVDFHFGQAVGATGTVQEKTATAKINSPGDIAPIGLSMNCMLSVANNMPALDQTLTGILPLNYMSTGPIKPKTIVTDWPNTWTEDSGITVAYQTGSPTSTYKGMPATILLQGSGWGLPGEKQIQVLFALDKGDDRKLYSAPAVPLSALGNTVAAVPDQVLNTVGVWEVKVAVRPLPIPLTNPDPAWKIAKTPVEFTVNVPAAISDLLGCGRAQIGRAHV